jgi:hypothetical protein
MDDEDELDAFHEQNDKIRKKYGFNDPPPDTWRGDEKRIVKAYRNVGWNVAIVTLVMGGAAYYLDIKYILVIGLGMIVGSLWSIHTQLFDLSVRLRRATTYLRQIKNGRTHELD